MPRVAMGSKHVRAVSSHPSIPGHGFCEKQTSSSVSYDYWPFSVIRWEIELRLSHKPLRDPPTSHIVPKQLLRPAFLLKIALDRLVDVTRGLQAKQF